MTRERRSDPHPVVWTILYLPFGALGGFVSVTLTFLATKNGLSITEGALLSGAQMVSQWLKWLWAPVVDIALTPRKWYVLSTVASAFGVLAMSSIPLRPETLGPLLAVIAIASLVNSGVGMAAEAILAVSTTENQWGRVSAWFQVGNIGGTGVGGALGLFLVENLPRPWMAGAVLSAIFVSCCSALTLIPNVGDAQYQREDADRPGRLLVAVRAVVTDLAVMMGTKKGILAALLCVLPIGTGAAQVVLTQARVAAFWGAREREVELVQGLFAGVLTALGSFGGGWLCQRFNPRAAYGGIGIGLALVAIVMSVSPATATVYVVWNLIYALGVGLAYSAFTAFVLNAMGPGSPATKYSIFASLGNFPIWWLGLLLGATAEKWGPRVMLRTEAGLGIGSAVVFLGTVGFIGGSLSLRDD